MVIAKVGYVMQTIFNTIIKMSLAGSILSLVLYFIRPMTHRIFSSTWDYISRVLIVLIFLIPLPLLPSLNISIPEDYSMFLKDNIISVETRTKDYEESSNKLYLLPIKFTNRQAIISSMKSINSFVTPIIKYIWLSGVIIYILIKLKHYFLFRTLMQRNREIKSCVTWDTLNQQKKEMSINRKIRLMSNDKIGTPMLIGIIHPTIVLPEYNFQQTELRFIFTHELIHLKRGDLLLKTITLIANVIHWFNPVFIPLSRGINRSCELSCDEGVIKKIDFHSRKRYAETILALLDRKTSKRYDFYSALNENAENIKRRLTIMLNYKEPKKSNHYFSIVVTITICILGFTLSATNLVFAENSTISLNMVWPASECKNIRAGYGERTHPITKEKKLHTGIDIEGDSGKSIVAAESGVVITSEWKGEYGNMVIIKHSGGITTSYAHCSKLLVKEGDEVIIGQEIALIGKTGISTGPHLHFEVAKDGQTQNPLDYVSIPD